MSYNVANYTVHWGSEVHTPPIFMLSLTRQVSETSQKETG